MYQLPESGIDTIFALYKSCCIAVWAISGGNFAICKPLSPDCFCLYEINCLFVGADIIRPPSKDGTFVLHTIFINVAKCLLFCSGEPCSPFVLCANTKQVVGALIGRPLDECLCLYIYYDVIKNVYSNLNSLRSIVCNAHERENRVLPYSWVVQTITNLRSGILTLTLMKLSSRTKKLPQK